jgi:hypothetical protein
MAPDPTPTDARCAVSKAASGARWGAASQKTNWRGKVVGSSWINILSNFDGAEDVCPAVSASVFGFSPKFP